MDKKPLWKTKTFAVGVIAVLGGLVKIIYDGDFVGGAEMILAGLGAMSLRHAVRKGEL